MSRWIMLLAASLAVLLLVMPSAVEGQEQGKVYRPPEDFVFEDAKDSPGPVTFSHAVHADKGV